MSRDRCGTNSDRYAMSRVCSFDYINIFYQYLGSILEATGATTLEIEKRIREGRRVSDWYVKLCLVEQNCPSQNQKKLMYQALVQSILLYGAETWTLNAQQANKLLATEMDFQRR
jgi:hypothetical protein